MGKKSANVAVIFAYPLINSKIHLESRFKVQYHYVCSYLPKIIFQPRYYYVCSYLPKRIKI